ncbi:hypothetical protein [Methylotenera sp.]|uniref:hypothetical protein n=1 Tax=Methylotenera sp. TaxID=2051956 RepID=UPI002487A7D6|nr:hypothetical protein [Methylotenera sp.]MDI1298806.1 hypothetical protein [Methylotenera sp.]
MKKFTTVFFALMIVVTAVYAALFFYGLPRESISRITDCTHYGARLLNTANSQLKIPYWMRYINFYLPYSPALCDIHLKNYRGNKSDIDFLNSSPFAAYDIARQNDEHASVNYGKLRNKNKNLENLRFLVNKGLNVNTKFDIMKSLSNKNPPILVSSLELAIGSKNPDIVEILLESGANPNIKNRNGMTSLELVNSIPEDYFYGSKDKIISILKKFGAQ